jgi:glutamate dehydrogenase/leucine dehydrogenase
MIDIGAAFDHERLEIFHDAATGVTGAIAIHSTVLGPAMGGLRLYSYNSLDEAAVDALRLARAMSLKNAAGGLDLGGGKAVVVDDGRWSSPEVRDRRMRAVGRIVDELGGRYITAEDVGTTPHDMEQIGRSTRWVAGLPLDRGGRGDPSPATARTVYGAIRSAVRIEFGREDLAGVRVGVQGVGHVGAALVALLTEAGAEVTLTDAVARRAVLVAQEHGAKAVEPIEFLHRDFDVLAPCALGEVISARDVAELRCRIVAGAANNPLEGPWVAGELQRVGILYVPDFLANCGGIIHVGAEAVGFGDAEVERLVAESVTRTEALLEGAVARGRTPWDVAVEFAETRIAGAVATTLKAAA